MNAKVLPKPVDWDELYPGRFLKAGDFKGKQVTLTISEVRIEELVGDKGPQIKGVISFEKTEKQWALNKTNGICLKEMFGRQVQEWVGKRVTLFPSQWNGELCIRVYGSPDIPADKEVTIALPRKRPFNMTMHRTGTGSKAKPADEAAEGFTEASAIEALEAAYPKGAKRLNAVWAQIEADYEERGIEIPLPVSAKFTDLKEALEGDNGGDL